jgi:hypothetical protein
MKVPKIHNTAEVIQSPNLGQFYSQFFLTIIKKNMHLVETCISDSQF